MLLLILGYNRHCMRFGACSRAASQLLQHLKIYFKYLIHYPSWRTIVVIHYPSSQNMVVIHYPPSQNMVVIHHPPSQNMVVIHHPPSRNMVVIHYPPSRNMVVIHYPLSRNMVVIHHPPSRNMVVIQCPPLQTMVVTHHPPSRPIVVTHHPPSRPIVVTHHPPSRATVLVSSPHHPPSWIIIVFLYPPRDPPSRVTVVIRDSTCLLYIRSVWMSHNSHMMHNAIPQVPNRNPPFCLIIYFVSRVVSRYTKKCKIILKEGKNKETLTHGWAWLTMDNVGFIVWWIMVAVIACDGNRDVSDPWTRDERDLGSWDNTRQCHQSI